MTISGSDDLWSEIIAVSSRARATGALVPVETHGAVLRDDGVEFLVRVLANLRRKEAASEPTSATTPRRNPFLPYESELRVADLSPSHVCLLNKFNVVDHHVLVITRDFESQESALTLADFAAWVTCLRAFPSVGFYNGGLAAGASQPHKHMQVVPAPLGGLDAPHVPFEPLVRAARSNDAELFMLRDESGPGDFGTVERFPFRHVVARIESWDAEHWRQRYDDARRAIGVVAADDSSGRLPPHNLVVTRDWMLLVPRSVECFAGISLNALAFVGAFLVRDEAQLARLRAAGPWRALASTGIPREQAERGI